MARVFPFCLLGLGLSGLLLISTDAFHSTAESMLQPSNRRGLALAGEPGPTEPPPVSPRDFLAEYRDGKTDCTEALQQLVDSGWGRIRLAKGIYRISRPVVIDLSKVGFTALDGGGVAQVVMAGPGPAFRFVGSHTGTASPRTVKPEVWNHERTPLVDGLEVVGEHPEAVGIEAEGTMQLTITRTVVRKALHGIRLTGRNRNVIVSECHLYENNGVGLFLDRLNLHQINVVNCHISYNKLGGIVSRLSEIRNLQIGICDIEGNMGDPGDPPAANIELDARNTSLGEVTIVGCTIQHGHKNDNSANIRIDGESIPSRRTTETRHSNITIADNVMSDVHINLEIRNIRGVTITGNTIWQGFDHNLILENCSNIVVANNVFERNERYRLESVDPPKHGLLISKCSDSIISGNVISGDVHHPASVTLQDSHRINFTGNSILDYNNTGLLLRNVTQSRVSDCIILSDNEQNPSGVVLENSPTVLLNSNLEKSTTFPEQ